jgi:hypothetical protein
MKKKMICVENFDLEDLLTIGKEYELDVKDYGMEIDENNIINEVSLIADDGEGLATLIDRFNECM